MVVLIIGSRGVGRGGTGGRCPLLYQRAVPGAALTIGSRGVAQGGTWGRCRWNVQAGGAVLLGGAGGYGKLCTAQRR